MKHLFALFLLLLVTGTATAQRFQVGQITFTVTSAADKTVAVTAYESTADDGDLVYIPVGSNRRSKAPAASYDVEVPETVNYDGTTYSVTAIADNAFMGLYLMQSISLPATLQSVGKTAFCDCTGLKEIVCFASTPPHAASNAFYRVDTSNCTLQVPAGLVTAYQTAEVWREFSFAVQASYTLTYYIDDALYATKTVLEGATITNEIPDEREGYTFAGWEGLPDDGIMPGHDVTVTGTYTLNSYKLTLVVEGEEYEVMDVNYGATIALPAEPTREGSTFTGWQGLPANLVMPAHDVTATGQFVKNPCAAPVVTLRDGKIVFTSATPGAKFHYTLGLKGFGVEALTDEEVEMPELQLEVSVYATAEGYTASATTIKAFDHCTLTTTPGDVDGNNMVSVSDVAKLINILLKK